MKLHRFAVTLLTILFVGGSACSGDSNDDDDDDGTGLPNDDDIVADDDDDFPPRVYPSALLTADQRRLALDRIDDPQYGRFYDLLVDQAAEAYDPGQPDQWEVGPERNNARIALSNAFLAYLHDDAEAARKATDILTKVRTDFETQSGGGFYIGIRLPTMFISYSAAWDLLMGTDFFGEEDSAASRALIVEVVQKFFDQYINNEVMAATLLHPTQNNYNARTGGAIGFPALVFPEEAEEYGWLDLALSELDYMFSPIGHYIYEDGGVSEGPNYWRFGFDGAYPVFFALENMGLESVEYFSDCRLRTDLPPKDDHGCVDGTPSTFVNPLRDDFLKRSIEWPLRIRMPNGDAPPFDDSQFKTIPWTMLFSGVYPEVAAQLNWHWEENETDPAPELGDPHENILALVWHDASAEAQPPDWTPSQFMPYSGQGVLRSDWSRDALWMMMSAEPTPARQTVHDHIDNNHIQLYAHGEYLLMDTGYYKPNKGDNAVTAHAPNHNMILVDGQGPTPKGKLFDTGGDDAFLLNTLPYDPEIGLGAMEGHTRYAGMDWTRIVLMARGEYGLVFDLIEADAQHEYTWRMHGFASGDTGHPFRWLDGGLGGAWERETGGVKVYVGSTSGAPLVSEAPNAHELSAEVNAHRIEEDPGTHFVMDAAATGEDIAFLSVLAPYSIQEGAPGEMLEVVSLEAPENVWVWRIERPGQYVDLAIVNRTGEKISIDPNTDEEEEAIINGAVPFITVESDAMVTWIGDIHGEAIGWFARGMPGQRVQTLPDLAVLPLENRGLEGLETNSIGMTLKGIPAGRFWMGSPLDEEGRQEDEPQHDVLISQPYFIGVTEVTRAQYREVMGSDPSQSAGCESDACPVDSVTRNDAFAFCNALSEREGLTPCYAGSGAEAVWDPTCDGYRLPTEAEWERAARAGTKTPLFNGGIAFTDKSCEHDPGVDEVGWYCGNTDDAPMPVGMKMPNPWGLYDMHGNVREWVWDLYGEYPHEEELISDPTGALESGDGVLRGGSYNNNPAWVRSALRRLWPLGLPNRYTGFRIVRQEM